MNAMATLIATVFPVLVLGAMDAPETAFAQYLGTDLEKERSPGVLICALEGCSERWVLRGLTEQLQELRLPEERQKLQSIEKRLEELQPGLRLLNERGQVSTQSLERAENLLLDKRAELRLYDTTYVTKFLILGVAVAVSIFFVWRMTGKSIDKNR